MILREKQLMKIALLFYCYANRHIITSKYKKDNKFISSYKNKEEYNFKLRNNAKSNKLYYN